MLIRRDEWWYERTSDDGVKKTTKELRVMLADGQPQSNLRQVLFGILDLIDTMRCTEHEDCAKDLELAIACASEKAKRGK